MAHYVGCSVIGLGYPTWLELLKLLRLASKIHRRSNTQGSFSKILTQKSCSNLTTGCRLKKRDSLPACLPACNHQVQDEQGVPSLKKNTHLIKKVYILRQKKKN